MEGKGYRHFLKENRKKNVKGRVYQNYVDEEHLGHPYSCMYTSSKGAAMGINCRRKLIPLWGSSGDSRTQVSVCIRL